ncbi:ABC transporter permease [Phreatobacter stygius]|uniref:ABC transporter permease n=2 Tax=Phreatobacter stygius TaxID=1940610 RepID=A0A4D7BIE4_9HYPH|nr:ABC transporter permease [Phreatobacter stygius]
MSNRRLANLLWPIFGVLSLLALWWAAIVVFDVKPFIAPSPFGVIEAVGVHRGLLLTNLWPTLIEALSGFLIGNVAAVAVASVFVHSATLKRMYFPVAIIFNTIPVIALSPVLITIFGLSIASKILIAAIICFFPTLVNMIRGFESVSASELELMRMMSATRSEVFFRLRLPRSMPFLFSALRIACTTSVIGAIVSEWIGSESGIGALIIQATFNYRTDLLYAAILTSSALALAMFGTVSALEWRFVRWRTA